MSSLDLRAATASLERIVLSGLSERQCDITSPTTRILDLDNDYRRMCLPGIRRWFATAAMEWHT